MNYKTGLRNNNVVFSACEDSGLRESIESCMKGRESLLEMAKAHLATSIILKPQEKLTKNCPKRFNFSLFPIPISICYGSELNSIYNCTALTVEWYRLTVENRDFFNLFESGDHDFIRRINFLHEYLNAYFHGKNSQAKFVIPIDLCKMLATTYDNFNLTKILGLHTKQVSVSFYEKKDGIINGTKVDRAINQNPITENYNSPQCIMTMLSDSFSSLELYDLKFIVYKRITTQKTTNEKSRYNGHCIGMTSIINDKNELVFLFYDSDAGQFCFSQLSHMRDFVLEYLQGICKMNEVANILMCIETYSNPSCELYLKKALSLMR